MAIIELFKQKGDDLEFVTVSLVKSANFRKNLLEKEGEVVF